MQTHAATPCTAIGRDVKAPRQAPLAQCPCPWRHAERRSGRGSERQQRAAAAALNLHARRQLIHNLLRGLPALLHLRGAERGRGERAGAVRRIRGTLQMASRRIEARAGGARRRAGPAAEKQTRDANQEGLNNTAPHLLQQVHQPGKVVGRLLVQGADGCDVAVLPLVLLVLLCGTGAVQGGHGGRSRQWWCGGGGGGTAKLARQRMLSAHMWVGVGVGGRVCGNLLLAQGSASRSLRPQAAPLNTAGSRTKAAGTGQPCGRQAGVQPAGRRQERGAHPR